MCTNFAELRIAEEKRNKRTVSFATGKGTRARAPCCMHASGFFLAQSAFTQNVNDDGGDDFPV